MNRVSRHTTQKIILMECLNWRDPRDWRDPRSANNRRTICDNGWLLNTIKLMRPIYDIETLYEKFYNRPNEWQLIGAKTRPTTTTWYVSARLAKIGKRIDKSVICPRLRWTYCLHYDVICFFSCKVFFSQVFTLNIEWVRRLIYAQYLLINIANV